MESIISTFHIDWKIIIAQAINFAVVFVVLYLFALKPLNKLMTERTDKIKKGVDDAKTNDAMLKATKEEYADMLAKARVEASKIFQETKKEGQAEKSKMVEQGKIEVAGAVENGKKALQSEKAKMVEEAKKEIASLAILATEKLMSSKTDLNNL
ncbi:MAG: F0F1 ATP synthase subunit B [Patescibacteria group bacterium]